jgi:UDPglucose 6-dehydrogenase
MGSVCEKAKGAARVKVTVVGLGYVGLSNALVMSRRRDVLAYDTDVERLGRLEARTTDLEGPGQKAFFARPELRLRAEWDRAAALSGSRRLIHRPAESSHQV